MRNVIGGFVVLALGLATSPLWAWERGTTGADYLKIGLGAGAVGMGEAYTASSGDVTSMFYNPAGLAFMDANQLTATHLNWVADTQYEALAYAQPNVDLGTLGASLFMLHMPPIPARDELNQDRGTVQAYDLGVQFSYAKDLRWTQIPGLEGWAGGASVKILHRELAGSSASGAALDLGVLYTGMDHFAAGFSCSNAGYLSRFASTQDYLPLILRLGTAYTLDLNADQALTGALDLVQGIDSPLKAHMGLEYSLLRMIHLRAGYKIGYDNDGLQAGAGLGWRNFSVDYAAKLMGVFGLTHYVSASVGFGARMAVQQQDRGQALLGQAEALYSQSRYPEALQAAEEAVLINPKSEPARQLRDKLKTVIEMLQLPADPNAPATGPSGPLSPDELEEKTNATPQEVKP